MYDLYHTALFEDVINIALCKIWSSISAVVENPVFGSVLTGK